MQDTCRCSCQATCKSSSCRGCELWQSFGPGSLHLELIIGTAGNDPNSQWRFSYLDKFIWCFLPRWCCTFQMFNVCLHQDCQLTAKQRYCFQLPVFYSWCPLSHFSLPLHCYFSFIQLSWFSPLPSPPFHTITKGQKFQREDSLLHTKIIGYIR